MYTEQNESCAICGKHSSEFSRKLCVDHDHTTEKVRALLCVDCNRNVGVYENYGEIIMKYLTQFKEGGASVS